MNKIRISVLDNFQNYKHVFQVDSPFGKISLFITKNNQIDPKSLIPWIIHNEPIDYMDLNKILIENGHQNKCKFYNYLILEFLNYI